MDGSSRGKATEFSSTSLVDAGQPIDRYVVMEFLAEGGMGAIYVGRKLGVAGFEMEVVLKQLLPEFTQQEEFIDLFLREAKLSATLDHTNIVHTIDLVTAGGEYFIVMEYLPGGDLRTLLKKAKRRGKRFSPSAAIHICREILSALAYAHVKRDFDGNPLRLIHRDVSPSNILVSHAGEVKLTDFGIAKASTHNPLFYRVMGKLAYMSPEQARSEALDHRSDLYSLAVCLYEALTGLQLFVHDGLCWSADDRYRQPLPRVSHMVAGLTPEIDAIMARALAPLPHERYQTAGEFQDALTHYAHSHRLLRSAHELVEDLRAACGEPDQWRGDDDADPESPTMFAPKARIGRYAVVNALGRSGVADEFEVEDAAGVRYMLKAPVKDVRDAEVTRRFAREANALRLLDHPNLVAAVEVFIEAGRLFLVTEKVAGVTLASVLELGPMQPRRVLGLARQILAGAGHAHAHGVVHRDIRPENIVLVDMGGWERVKIMDFGLVKLVGDAAAAFGIEALTFTGFPLEATRYMAPEQARRQQVDQRVDLYAVGVILHDALADRPEYTPRVKSLVDGALARNPADRFPTCEAMMVALDEAIASLA